MAYTHTHGAESDGAGSGTCIDQEFSPEDKSFAVSTGVPFYVVYEKLDHSVAELRVIEPYKSNQRKGYNGILVSTNIKRYDSNYIP